MKQFRLAQIAAVLVAVAALLGLAPASASALGVTITDDAGQPVPFANGIALRNMNPSVGIAFGASENGNYNATYAGPDGLAAASPVNCFGIPVNRSLDYRGNGVYTVTIQKYAENDRNCATPQGAPQVYQATITGSVALSGPATPVLLRAPNAFARNTIALPIAGNPGALSNEIKYALNGIIGPDGGLAGLSADAFVDRTTGTVQFTPPSAGRFVLVARAKGFSTGGGQFFTPWSPPVTVNVLAPFDIETFRTTDSRGPSYRVRIQIRERTARGRVSIAIARGKRGGKYRSYGSVKISSKATFTKRMTLRRTGNYRIRFKYKGSGTVAGGTVVQGFRISRRFAF